MAEEERDRKWTVLRLRGLRKRWIVNTILPVLVLLMLLVTLVSVSISTYYYSSMENGLMKPGGGHVQCLQHYFMNSYCEYNQMATQAVDTYEDKSRIELQFIGSTGRIQMSTSGLTSRQLAGYQRYYQSHHQSGDHVLPRQRPGDGGEDHGGLQRPCCSTAGWRASCGW